MSKTRVIGLEEALFRIKSEAGAIKMRSLAGVTRGGLVIKRAAQKLVPVDTANLKASAFIVFDKTGVGTRGALSAMDEVPNFSATKSPKRKAGRSGTGRSARGKGSGSKVDVAKLQADHLAALTKAAGETAGKAVVLVGFSASYAIFVHEDMTKNHTTGEAKFLERAVTGNISEVVAAIRRGAEKR